MQNINVKGYSLMTKVKIKTELNSAFVNWNPVDNYCYTA